MRHILLALALGLSTFTAPAFAQPEKPAKKTDSDTITLPTPADVKDLQVTPKDFTLVGEDDARQLVLTGVLKNGAYQDLTGDAQYEVADAKILRVTSGGRVMPLANGSTTITARYGDKSVVL